MRLRGTTLAFVLASCSCVAGGLGNPYKSGAQGDATPVSSGEGDASAEAPTCGDEPDTLPAGSTCVLAAKGTVEDLAGAPLSQIAMTFCGAECFGTRSDAAGAYSMPIGLFLPTADYAVHADGRPDYAVDYRRLAASEPPVIDVAMRIPRMPPSNVDLPPDGAPASTVTVGDLTLVVPDNTTFDLSLEDYMVTRALRVAPVPVAMAPSYAADANVSAIYALAPSGCTPTNRLGVVLRNSAGLRGSTAVEFLVLSDDYGSDPPTVGLLQVQATGHVSADAQTIQTAPGQGIGELTWLAVREAN